MAQTVNQSAWHKVISGWWSYRTWTARRRDGYWLLTNPTETLPTGDCFNTLTQIKQYVRGYESALIAKSDER